MGWWKSNQVADIRKKNPAFICNFYKSYRDTFMSGRSPSLLTLIPAPAVSHLLRSAVAAPSVPSGEACAWTLAQEQFVSLVELAP